MDLDMAFAHRFYLNSSMLSMLSHSRFFSVGFGVKFGYSDGIWVNISS